MFFSVKDRFHTVYDKTLCSFVDSSSSNFAPVVNRICWMHGSL